MIFVGLDDTDTRDTPGTNWIARGLVARVSPLARCTMLVRHQLLVDPRVPYTSKNSSASLLFEDASGLSLDRLTDELRHEMRERFVPGSDPGLCVTRHVPEAVTAFGRRCQREVMSQDAARRLAAAHGIGLHGLGGTEDGVIGALAAVGLAASRNDGRVVVIGSWPDDLSGVQPLSAITARGVSVRRADTGAPIAAGMVDVGKRLRANYRDGRVVLFVRLQGDDRAASFTWEAVREA